MLKPLIIHPSLVVEVNSQPEQGAVLSLQCTETKAEHPDPSQVYTKVLTVLKTLHEHLFGMCFGDQKKFILITIDIIVMTNNYNMYTMLRWGRSLSPPPNNQIIITSVYTLPPKLSSVKTIRIRFDFLRFRIRSMHFDRKGWGIRKKLKKAYANILD